MTRTFIGIDMYPLADGSGNFRFLFSRNCTADEELKAMTAVGPNSASMFRNIRKIAERTWGTAPDTAVVTSLPGFRAKDRENLRSAMKEAGFSGAPEADRGFAQAVGYIIRTLENPSAHGTVSSGWYPFRISAGARKRNNCLSIAVRQRHICISYFDQKNGSLLYEWSAKDRISKDAAPGSTPEADALKDCLLSMFREELPDPDDVSCVIFSADTMDHYRPFDGSSSWKSVIRTLLPNAEILTADFRDAARGAALMELARRNPSMLPARTAFHGVLTENDEDEEPKQAENTGIPEPESAPDPRSAKDKAAEAAKLHEQALALHKEEKYKEEFELLKKADQLLPNNLETKVRLGRCSRCLNRFQAALDYYEEAEKLSPTDPIIPMNRGAVYLTLGSNEKAREFYNESLLRFRNVSNYLSNPDYAILLGNSAIAEARCGNRKLALERISEAERLGYANADNVRKMAGL